MRSQTLASLLVLVCLSIAIVACGSAGGPSAPPPVPSFLYVLGQISTQEGQILTLPIDQNTGALGAAVAVPGPMPPPTAFALDETKFLYIAQLLPLTQIFGYGIDQRTGAVSAIPSSPFLSPSNTLLNGGTAVNNFLYMGGTSFLTNGVAPTVSAFSIGTDGTLSSTVSGSPFTAAPPTNNLSGTGPALAVLSRYLYATEFEGQIGQPGGIAAFSTNTGTGTLTPLSGSPFPTGVDGSPVQVICDSAHGPFLYVALVNPPGGQNVVAGFSIDQNTGALTPVPGSPFPIGGVLGLALDPSGQFLFAGINVPGPNIVEFKVESDGSLTPLPGVSGVGPPFVFSANHMYGVASSSSIAGFDFDTATGSLTPVPGSPFSAGTPIVRDMVAVTLPSP